MNTFEKMELELLLTLVHIELAALLLTLLKTTDLLFEETLRNILLKNVKMELQVMEMAEAQLAQLKMTIFVAEDQQVQQTHEVSELMDNLQTMQRIPEQFNEVMERNTQLKNEKTVTCQMVMAEVHPVQLKLVTFE